MTIEDYLDDIEYQCPVLQKMTRMIVGSRKRAAEKDWDHDLTLPDLFELYVEICPILGIDILWDNTEVVRHGSPSLDRVNNKKGYVKGNVQIISHRANSLKKDYLLVEWEKMRDYMQMCDGTPIVIDDAYFKESSELSDHNKRRIRAGLKRGEDIVEMSKDLEITIGSILKYQRSLTESP